MIKRLYQSTPLRVGIAILALTVVASAGTGFEEKNSSDVVEPAMKPPAAAQRGESLGSVTPTAVRVESPSVADELDTARLVRTQREKPLEDLFASQNWRPAPVAAPVMPVMPPVRAPEVPPAPPAPSAPPLPFKYLGRAIDGERSVIFLANGPDSLAVAAGDSIGTDYKVESITDTAVQFTFLPMGLKQELSIPPRN